MSDAELLARVFLARVVEPGDGTAGRWVRELGVHEVADRLRGGGQALPGVSGKRWAGLLARAGQADPHADHALARDAGAPVVCPRDRALPL
ncbi:DNA-protecting protein DprA, partial [Streptomyces sp. NPDC059627]